MEKVNVFPRILALFLTLATAIPSPALALRVQTVPESRALTGLEEDLKPAAPSAAGLEEGYPINRAGAREFPGFPSDPLPASGLIPVAPGETLLLVPALSRGAFQEFTGKQDYAKAVAIRVGRPGVEPALSVLYGGQFEAVSDSAVNPPNAIRLRPDARWVAPSNTDEPFPLKGLPVSLSLGRSNLFLEFGRDPGANRRYRVYTLPFRYSPGGIRVFDESHELGRFRRESPRRLQERIQSQPPAKIARVTRIGFIRSGFPITPGRIETISWKEHFGSLPEAARSLSEYLWGIKGVGSIDLRWMESNGEPLLLFIPEFAGLEEGNRASYTRAEAEYLLEAYRRWRQSDLYNLRAGQAVTRLGPVGVTFFLGNGHQTTIPFDSAAPPDSPGSPLRKLLDQAVGSSSNGKVEVRPVIEGQVITSVKVRPAMPKPPAAGLEEKFPDPVEVDSHPSFELGHDGHHNTFLERGLEQEEPLTNLVLPDLVRRNEETKTITFAFLGTSTGEEVARFWYWIRKWFDLHGLAIGGGNGWQIRLIAVEKDKPVLEEAKRCFRGESPFVYWVRAREESITLAQQIVKVVEKDAGYLSRAIEWIPKRMEDKEVVEKVVREADVIVSNTASIHLISRGQDLWGSLSQSQKAWLMTTDVDLQRVQPKTQRAAVIGFGWPPTTNMAGELLYPHYLSPPPAAGLEEDSLLPSFTLPLNSPAFLKVGEHSVALRYEIEPERGSIGGRNLRITNTQGGVLFLPRVFWERRRQSFRSEMDLRRYLEGRMEVSMGRGSLPVHARPGNMVFLISAESMGKLLDRQLGDLTEEDFLDETVALRIDRRTRENVTFTLVPRTGGIRMWVNGRPVEHGVPSQLSPEDYMAFALESPAERFAEQAGESSVFVVLGPTALRQVRGLRQAVETLEKTRFRQRLIVLPEGPSVDELAGIIAQVSSVPDPSFVAYADEKDEAVERFERVAADSAIPYRRERPEELAPVVRRILLNLGVPAGVATQAAVERFLAAVGLEEAA